jgi:putative ABC transport system permease protein
MSLFARVLSILDGVFRRNRMERGMDEEIRFHVARYADDLERTGIPRAEAERRARREFGPLEPVKEECRQARGLRLLDETVQDLRYAVRSLRRSPGFAAVSILTLATGIGANTAIFTIIDRWVLRPLPYHDAANLVSISTIDAKGGAGSTAPADLYDWRANGKGFEAICGWTQPFLTLTAGGDPEQILGVQAMLSSSPCSASRHKSAAASCRRTIFQAPHLWPFSAAASGTHASAAAATSSVRPSRSMATP